MNAVDFDDLLVIPVKILSDFPEIRDYYQESWRFLLVDEYQDTNKVQNRFIKLLAEKYTNVCAIGDADQAIYSFRGANPENILQFSTHYPKTKTVKLEQNYRSTQTILAAANAVIENNSSRLEKKMFSAGAEGQKIKLKECSHEREEAFFVMEEIFRLKSERGYDFQDFTLLYRTNVQSRVLEEAALRYSIPYQIVGGLKFYARKEIKDLLAYLRLIANSVDTVSFLRIVNVPTRKVGKVTLGRLENYAVSKGLELPEILRHLEMVEGITKLAKANLIKLAKKIADLRQKSTSVPVSQLVETVIKEFDLENYYRDGTEEGEMRFENIQELISVAQKFDGSDSSLALFLEEVALITDADSVDDKQDRITLMTMHNAKGLEFKVVFLVGAEENILPHSRSMGTFEGLEEERRLFYVAMTRAMERLYITNARTRMIFGDYSANIASRFLTELPDDYLENMSKNQSSSIEEDISLTPIYEDFYPDLVLDFEEAEEVEHSVFGSGVIEKIEGDILTINFGSFGTKRMAASIAPLRKK
jgi:DNA helicase-2/ATP-dependent DNA helicase PcrA